MTTIRMTGTLLEFINDDTGIKVVIEQKPEKTEYGLTWYTVEVYEKGRAGIPKSYVQVSRNVMSDNALDLAYDWLVNPVGSEPVQLNKEHISFDTFKSLVASLRV